MILAMLEVAEIHPLPLPLVQTAKSVPVSILERANELDLIDEIGLLALAMLEVVFVFTFVNVGAVLLDHLAVART